VTDSVRRLAQFVRSDLPKSAALDVVGLKGPWRETCTRASTAEGERSPRLGGKPSFHATHIWLLIQWLRPFQANLAFFGFGERLATITAVPASGSPPQSTR